MNYAELVASKMKTEGLESESQKIGDISRVLREDELSPVEHNYFMSVDEDFIPDVLAAYKQLLEYIKTPPTERLR
jgi:hypothetical protein